MENINTVNITAAAFITQSFLILMMAIAAAIIRNSERMKYRDTFDFASREVRQFPWIILICALVSITFLIFTNEFIAIWKPLFSINSLPIGIEHSTTLMVMFLTDILIIGYLTTISGGSQNSPFTPILFILPALAIFLRESYGMLVLYVILVSVEFTINLKQVRSRDLVPGSRLAYWFISVSCLILTTLIAYLTRPL